MSESWSSEENGWSFQVSVKPASLRRFPGRQSRIDVMKEHYEPYLKKLTTLLPAGVRIESVAALVGSACLVGDEQACILFKNQVESEGWATMVKNEEGRVSIDC